VNQREKDAKEAAARPTFDDGSAAFGPLKTVEVDHLHHFLWVEGEGVSPLNKNRWKHGKIDLLLLRE